MADITPELNNTPNDAGRSGTSGGGSALGGSILGLAVRGTAIRMGMQFALKFMTVVQTYFFVRMFTENDFGYQRVAALTATIILQFSQIGLAKAILRGEGDQRNHMDVALLLNLIVGVLFCLIIIISGVIGGLVTHGWVQALYVSMMAYTAFGPAFSLPAILWDRHMKFHLSAIPAFLTFGVGFLGTVILYFSGFSQTIIENGAPVTVRSGCLILGAAMGWLASNLFIWFYAPYRPRPRWDPVIARELIQFGWPLVFTAIFSYIAWNADQWFIYIYQGQKDLGVYTIAFFIPMFLAQLQDAVCDVLLPALRQARSKESMHRGFLVANRYMGILACAGGLLVWAYARPITSYYLGGGVWRDAQPLLALFGLALFIRTLTGWGWWVLPMLKGNTKPIMWANLAYAIAMLTVGHYLIYTKGNLGGAQAGLFIALAIVPFPRLIIIYRTFRSFRSLFVVWPALCAGLIMGACSRWVLEPHINNNLSLLCYSLVSLFIFTMAYLVFDRGRIIGEIMEFTRHGLSATILVSDGRRM